MQDQQKPDPKTTQDKKPSVDKPLSLADYFAMAGLIGAGAAGWYVLIQVLSTPVTQGGPAPYGSYGIEDIFQHGPH